MSFLSTILLPGRPRSGAFCRLLAALILGTASGGAVGVAGETNRAGLTITASSAVDGYSAAGAMDGDRFSPSREHSWKGNASPDGRWSWRVQFPTSRKIGAILQIQGDHDFVFTNAPLRYGWFASDDGQRWSAIPGTSVEAESRIFRVHRLPAAIAARFVELRVLAANGFSPTLREVEFFSAPKEKIGFPPWVVLVNSTDDPRLPNHGQEFLPLIRSCPGWEKAPAQQVWVGQFNPELAAIEPRPVCVFFSGSFKDWCEVDRETWRGTQKVLERGDLPAWASCGGAQALAILAETGVDHPWDCPHCRDPKHPKIPIYTHLGHTGSRLCGDYSACIFERGLHKVLRAGNDPVFQGLPEEFEVMESHCGQIEWAPAGWELVAKAGAGTQTAVQCIRRTGRPIYAAQFHIEMSGASESSRTIMRNFLTAAREWRERK